MDNESTQRIPYVSIKYIRVIFTMQIIVLFAFIGKRNRPRSKLTVVIVPLDL